MTSELEHGRLDHRSSERLGGAFVPESGQVLLVPRVSKVTVFVRFGLKLHFKFIENIVARLSKMLKDRSQLSLPWTEWKPMS